MPEVAPHGYPGGMRYLHILRQTPDRLVLRWRPPWADRLPTFDAAEDALQADAALLESYLPAQAAQP